MLDGCFFKSRSPSFTLNTCFPLSQVIGSISSRFFAVNNTGRIFFFNYFLITHLPGNQSCSRPHSCKNLSALRVKVTNHQISLLHDYLGLAEMIISSRTRSLVLPPSSRPQCEHTNRQFIIMAAMSAPQTENYCNRSCKALLYLSLGRWKKHHTTSTVKWQKKTTNQKILCFHTREV